MLKVLISFFAGTAVGAAVALLLAPSSGEDLRQHLYDVAEADRERMRTEYQKGMEELQSRIDQISSEVGSAFQNGEEVDEEADIDIEGEAAPEAA